MKQKNLIAVIVVVAVLLLFSCVCAGLVVVPIVRDKGASPAQATLRAALATQAQVDEQAKASTPMPQPQQQPSSTTPSTTFVPPAPAGSLDIQTSYPSPVAVKKAFPYTIKAVNQSSSPARICAINFRGNITSVLEENAISSPRGQVYWVTGNNPQQGVIFDPCIVIPSHKQSSFVFNMKIYTAPSTWKGEIGFCSKSPAAHPEALDQCFYVPVVVKAP